MNTTNDRLGYTEADDPTEGESSVKYLIELEDDE